MSTVSTQFDSARSVCAIQRSEFNCFDAVESIQLSRRCGDNSHSPIVAKLSQQFPQFNCIANSDTVQKRTQCVRNSAHTMRAFQCSKFNYCDSVARIRFPYSARSSSAVNTESLWTGFSITLLFGIKECIPAIFPTYSKSQQQSLWDTYLQVLGEPYLLLLARQLMSQLVAQELVSHFHL